MKTAHTILAMVGLAAAAACAPMEDSGSGSPMTPPVADAGQCKLDQYQTWVGRNRSELPTPPAGETWRVTCTTCPVTMDFNPNRLNILFEQQTGVIRQVKCG